MFVNSSRRKSRVIVPFFERSTKNGRYNTRRKVWRIPGDWFCHGRSGPTKPALAHSSLPVMSQFEMAVSVFS
jgi:hypothetical protein